MIHRKLFLGIGDLTILGEITVVRLFNKPVYLRVGDLRSFVGFQWRNS